MAREGRRSDGVRPGHGSAQVSSGAVGIDWADRAMPVLASIRERFSAERPLSGARIAACMHVTAETANLVRTLAAAGAQVALCASNPLSTQDDTADSLRSDFGIEVHARRGVGRDEYYAQIDRALDLGPQIVLDDGCDLVTRLHTERTDVLDQVLAGCEDTASGVVRLRRMSAAGALRFPVLAVDASAAKRIVDNRHGTGQSTVDAILRTTRRLLAGATVVVAGYGAGGRGVAARLRGMGATVVVTEIDPLRALDASLSGYSVMPMSQALPSADIVVTVTGNRDVVRAEHLDLLADETVLLNAGHFDVEIDVAALAQRGGPPRRIRPHLDQYTLTDGRRVLLIAEGRVANVSAADGHPAAVMDLSFAAQALSVRWLMSAAAGLSPDVYPVPSAIDEEIAAVKLASMGVQLDTLTDAQRAYVESWEQSS